MINTVFVIQGDHVLSFKQSRRREDDIAIVNSCMFVHLSNDEHKTVEHIRMAFGGMSYKTITALATESKLTGR